MKDTEKLNDDAEANHSNNPWLTVEYQNTIKEVVEEVVEDTVKDVVKRTVEDAMAVFLDQINVEKVQKKKTPGLLDSQLCGWFSNATDELLTGFKIGPEDTVVDVGCGNGAHLKFCGKRGAALICIDQDETGLKKVVAELRKTEARSVEHYVSDGNPLPLADGSVNRVICNEVLEHVDDPVAFINEVVRIGCSGAKYMMGITDHISEDVIKELACPGYFEKPNHVRIFQREEFDKLVTDAGLIIEHKQYYGFYWSMWWFLFWALDVDSDPDDEPLLKSWANTWDILLKSYQGKKVKHALDKLAPKSQIIVAYKP